MCKPWRGGEGGGLLLQMRGGASVRREDGGGAGGTTAGNIYIERGKAGRVMSVTKVLGWGQVGSLDFGGLGYVPFSCWRHL